MEISEIIKMPTVIDNKHESVLRSYHILIYVLKMIHRGDSKETILEVAQFLRDYI